MPEYPAFFRYKNIRGDFLLSKEFAMENGNKYMLVLNSDDNTLEVFNIATRQKEAVDRIIQLAGGELMPNSKQKIRSILEGEEVWEKRGARLQSICLTGTKSSVEVYLGIEGLVKK